MTEMREGAEVGPEDEQVSPGYAIVMFEVPVPPLQVYRFVERLDPKFFIQAQEPSEEGKLRIQNAGLKIDAAAVLGAGGNRQERRGFARRNRQAVMGGGIDINADAAFVQKCLEQITDFYMPTVVMGPDMKPRPAEQRFDPANGGDNPANRGLYGLLLKRHNQQLQRLVEDYLDWAGGRTEDAIEDFNDLGNAR